MIRYGFLTAATLLLAACEGGEEDAPAATQEGWEARDQQIAALRENPPRLGGERQVEGYRIGRCLLEVDGRTRISGPCYYRLDSAGGFYMAGPRQVFAGVDYPRGAGAPLEISTDWWANVFAQDGAWTGYGNEEVEYTKGEGSRWGELEKDGPCFSNEELRPDDDAGDYHPDYRQRVRVCLWTEEVASLSHSAT